MLSRGKVDTEACAPNVTEDDDGWLADPRASLLRVPWQDVFRAVSHHRSGLLRWLALLDEPARDVILSASLRLILRQRDVGFWRWLPVSSQTVVCSRTIESAHPMPTGPDLYVKVSFPGSSSLKISFDPRCSVDFSGRLKSYVEIFQDEALTASRGVFPGLEGGTRASGGGGSDEGDGDATGCLQVWPGDGRGAPALVVPGDFVVIHIKSDQALTAAAQWGVRLTVEGDVCKEALHR